MAADATGGEIDPRAWPTTLRAGRLTLGLRTPFRMAEIRAAIPNPCSVKDPWRLVRKESRDVWITLQPKQ